jgi:hypothetical protein
MKVNTPMVKHLVFQWSPKCRGVFCSFWLLKRKCALVVGTPIALEIIKSRINMNEIWRFEGRGVKSEKLKSLEHMVAYG